MKIKYLLPLVLLFVGSFIVDGQNLFPAGYDIAHIDMDNGLMHDFIDDIYKDNRGFIWFSTRGGLSRYDGYKFSHFNMDTAPVRLKGNFVHKSCGDKFNRLWIASEGGLDILDLDRMCMTDLFEEDAHARLVFLRQPVMNILNDSRGNMWVFSVSTLYKIQLDQKGGVENVFSYTFRSHSLRSVAMADMDYDGKIWISVDEEILKVDADIENNNLMINGISDKLRFERNMVVNSMVLKDSEVWIGTDNGLFRYFKKEDSILQYRHHSSNDVSLSQNHISDLCVASSRQLIVATLNGINIYDPENDGFVRIVKGKTSGENSLSSNFVNCLFPDDDLLWIGTETGGVNRLSPKNSHISTYSHVEGKETSISKNPVNSILEDADGDLWVGTVEGGLNRKKKGEETFTHYTADSSTRLSHNSVSALCVDDEDRLWVGTWGGGVSIISRKNPGQPASKYINTGTDPDFMVNFVSSLCLDKINNGMWIGTSQGLYFYDLASEKLLMPFKNKMPTSVSSFMTPVIDNDDKLWLGTSEGVFIIDLHSRRDGLFPYIHLRYKLDNKLSNLVDYISSLYLDSDGTLWLGSDGFGLYKRIVSERGDYSFESYTTSQGLVSNHVKGILEDDAGNLWISTNNGLSCFNRENNLFSNFHKESGLQSNHFYWNAFCRSKDGTLYFGTLDGLTGIRPGSVFLQNSDKYKVTLTDLYVNNQKAYAGEYAESDVSTAKKIVLHESDKSFSIDFSALNFKSQNNYIYSYKLDGYDSDWIELAQNEHTASYMNLPPGNYVFQAKYTPKDQSDFGEVARLDLKIKSYFYKTAWFIATVILLITSAVIFFYIMRLRAYEERQVVLQRIVDDRTHELKIQKGVLLRQKDELSGQNRILSEQNQKITHQKDQLIKMSQKLQKMNIDRMEFFTNISHEFRTPISLIIGPVERAMKLSTNPYVIEQLSFVERNSKYLMSLINQLMDFRKIESNKLDITYTKGDFRTFMESLLSPFNFQLADRNIGMRRIFSMEEPVIYYDDEALHKIMTNLLSNAIKFTPNGGEITVYVKSLKSEKSGNDILYISVKDNGTGIPDDDIDKVFRRFHQSKNQIRYPLQGQSGTGIGLYLCRQIAQMLGGSIQAKNNRKAGASFRVKLPLYKSNPNAYPVSTDILQKTDSKQDQSTEKFKEWGKDKLTFLVVEDNRDMRSYICSVLSPQYNTLEASDGVEALKVLSEYSVDFVISDLMMPEMDGLELSEKIKEDFSLSHIPVIMLTAKTSSKSRTESYRMGVDSYIVKPFDEEVLMTRIQNILKSRERHQHNFTESMSTDALEISEESNDKKFMDTVLEVMNSNYQNPYFDVGDFVDALGVSKSLLNKKLNVLSGKSAGQFIRVFRLNLAYKLILQNKVTKNKNISDIAYEVGFNDPKYFTRCFSKQFDITPSKLMED